jgi:Heterokaryon incompatibility protein (HET)
MAPYEYSKLEDESRDIRLLHLRPGQFYDDIQAAITLTSLVEPVSYSSQRLSLDKLETTLPTGWRVHETVEDRYIFEHPESCLTTWEHPDPNMPASAYNSTDDRYEEFQPRYEALSYTWGSAENPDVLFMESNESEATLSSLEIGQNLAGALRHLRHETETRTLWVDAVCINQQSMTERSTQVTRMTSIYKFAYSVVVWLGPESPDSKLAFTTLREIAAQTLLTKNATRLVAPKATHRDWLLSASTLPHGEDAWRAILGLVNRSWFDRVWIVQEIQLANPTAVLRCGHESIRWGHFCRAVYCILRKHNPPDASLAQRLNMIKILIQSSAGLSFRLLLYGSSFRQCSDLRDHVYGLLGLATPAVLREIRPQYAADIGTVYTDAFLAMYRALHRLDALQDCWLGTDRSALGKLPSWVPNWSASIQEQVGVHNSLYFGSGASRAEAVLYPFNVLEVAAVPCGIVNQVNGAICKDDYDALKAMYEWAPKDIFSGVYPTGETTLEAYLQILSLNKVRNRFPTAHNLLPALGELETMFKSVLDTSQPPTFEVLTTFFDQILASIKGRIFVTTNDGHFGLGPPMTEPGTHLSNVYD